MTKLQIEYLQISDLRPYENNARKHEQADIKAIENSINQFGMCDPIGIWGNQNIIVEGHGRLLALQSLGFSSAPCIRLDHLTDEQRRAYALAHNKTAELSEWDFEKLESELNALNDLDIDMQQFGFEAIEADEDLSANLDESRPTLFEKYIVPPFSVLDTRQGYWQARKKVWKSFIKSDEGRDTGLLGDGLYELAQRHYSGSVLTGTSIFDPVLSEILLRWFCPAGAKVLDCFAGGSVRGLVTAMLGNDYTGVDLSAKQIEANKSNFEALKGQKDLNGNDLKMPIWINGDSRDIDTLVDGEFDFLKTCPPYADLEVYSDDERDISNMNYNDFKTAYFEIIDKSCAKLKKNAFAAIVVGDVRDKNGYYYDFVGDTIEAFTRAGLKYYNECILINQIGTGAMRAGRQFSAARKVVKSHQNVLIFVKGNERMIDLQPYNYDFIEEEIDEGSD